MYPTVQINIPSEPSNISNKFSMKTNENCQRSRFSKEEDELLKMLVNSQSQPKWSEIAQHFHNRTARQCRERYNNYLRPDLINGPWTVEEDELLIQLYELHGPKWSLISQNFNSRSSVNVKNHYSSLSSQKLMKTRKDNNNTNIIIKQRKQNKETKKENNIFTGNYINFYEKVNFEAKQIIENQQQQQQQQLNVQLTTYEEEDNFSDDALDLSIEEFGLDNLISNFEVVDDMWSIPIASNMDEDEIFIF